MEEVATISPAPSDKLGLAVLGGAGCFWLLTSLVQGSVLIDHIPVWATIAGGIAGFSLGAWFALQSYRNPRRKRSVRNILGLALFPVMTIFLGTYAARYIVQTSSFYDVKSPTIPMLARVDDKDTKWQDKAGISFGPSTRQVAVRVSYDLYSRLEPWRDPGRDCLKVGVKSGRWGLREALLPSYLDQAWGLEHYQPCNSKGN